MTRFLGRHPDHVAADNAAILDALSDIEDAKAVWRDVDRLARDERASTYTRRRAQKAAVALGSLLDDIMEADAAEQGFSWNDPAPPDP